MKKTETVIIDGRAIAKNLREEISQTTDDLITRSIIPKIAIIHIGEDPASLSYTKSIIKISSKLNIEVDVHNIEGTTTNAHVIQELKSLNEDKKIHGILIQEPIPSTLNRKEISLSISSFKDIDCMNPINLGGVMRGAFPFAPSTPLGVLKLLEYENIDTEGKHVVIVGRSNIVGKPLANLLLIKGKGGNATVTVCHSRTKDLPFFTKTADILIVAIGKPEFITGNMLKQGTAVIDVGINDKVDKDGKHKLVGDVDFNSVINIASYITPVPGGVGPVTTMMLLSNLIKAAGRVSKE